MGRAVVIQQCPECRSLNVFYDLGGMTGRVYRCHDCGYFGPVVFELELSEEEVRALEEEREAELQERGEGGSKEPARRKGLFKR